MKELNFKNLNEVSIGDKILYDNRVGTVEYDKSYVGCLRVDGRSLRNIIEECEKVYLLD